MFDGGGSIWSVEWFDDNIPEKITIKIENNGVLENVKFGEEMGAITVSAENVFDVKVSPSGKNHIFISHPLYSYQQVTGMFRLHLLVILIFLVIRQQWYLLMQEK